MSRTVNLGEVPAQRVIGIQCCRDAATEHLCEVALAYFWDRVQEDDPEEPDVEYLLDATGMEFEELKSLFPPMGYEESY